MFRTTKRITIAIDGYSSCGKSTLARNLAAGLGYSYLDTGAMYRCVTLYGLQRQVIGKGISFDPESVAALLSKTHISFQFNIHTLNSDAYLNGILVEKEIRSLEVAELVSKVATIKEVRTFLVQMQRELGKEKGIVLDGRDIGTHVFPDAELKIFMTADMDVRVQRRVDEMNSKGMHVEIEQIRKNLHDRDYADTHRKENPLRQAKDAIVLDNSDLSKEGQLEFVARILRDLTLT